MITIKDIVTKIIIVAIKLINEFPDEIDKKFAEFLASPIALDSHFFDMSLKDSKWTDKDKDVYTFLNERGEIGKEFWEKLNNAKYDIELNLKIGIENLL